MDHFAIILFRLFFIVAIHLATMANAENRHEIFILNAIPDRLKVNNEAAANPIREQYLEQNSNNAFYSYGYRAANADRTEYSRNDGLAQQRFYSFISDADGQLQTNKYAAGSDRLAFKARIVEGSVAHNAGGATGSGSAVNMPSDINNNVPQPVQDTPEVQRAKAEHFKAFRNVLLRDQQMTADQIKSNAGNRHDGNDQATSNSDNNSNNNDDNNNNDNNANNDNLSYIGNADSNSDPIAVTDTTSNMNQLSQSVHPDMTTFILRQRYASDDNHNNNNNINLNANTNGNDNINDNEESDDNNIASNNRRQLYDELDLEEPETKSPKVIAYQIPVNAFHTVITPDVHYSFATPTILATVPAHSVLRMGSTLPISMSSTYTSKRL